MLKEVFGRAQEKGIKIDVTERFKVPPPPSTSGRCHLGHLLLPVETACSVPWKSTPVGPFPN